MKTIEKAKILRKKIEGMASELDDGTALDYTALFPYWRVSAEYEVGDRVRFEKGFYKCVQTHTSQADWTPDTAVSLWITVTDPAIEFPDWKQPTGAQDAYQTGDKVSHNEKHWISTADNNVWEPGIYGWSEV